MVYTKRLLSPEYYRTSKKGNKFIVTAIPGPHKKNRSIPLSVVLRDIMKLVEDVSEVKSILNKRMVKIDNKTQINHRFPIGFMDVISIDNSNYRVLVNEKGLYLKNIENNKNIKLLKITKKTYNKKNILQLGFHDGRTLIVDKDIYKTGDVAVFDIEAGKIKELLQFKRGSLVLITDGKNKGKVGKIEDIIIVRGSQSNRVVVKIGEEKIETLKDYVFVVGQDSSVIDL